MLPGPCRFGAFTFDPLRGRLARGSETVDLPHKAAELLALLIAHRGRVVLKAEIFDALWPDVAVQESNLTQTVYVLRKALGDARDGTEHVRTIPRRGYVFVADVQEEGAARAPSAVEPAASVPASPRVARLRSPWTVPALAIVGLAVGTAWSAGPRPRFGTATAWAGNASAAQGLPEDGEAARLYDEGLAELRVLEAAAARDRLERCAALSPASPLVHLALSQAWRALGHDARARESAQQAEQLAASLRPERRLAIEAQLAATANEWARSAELGASLTRLFPDELEHVLRRAEAETRAGRPREALTVLAAAARRSALDAGDPRLALAEVEAQAALGDHDAQRGAAERARTQAVARGARRLEATALSAHAWALRNAGRAAEAEELATRARALFAEVGDRNAEAIALNTLAAVRTDRGQHAEALSLWRECLVLRRAAGSRRGAVIVQNNLATVLTWQGRLDDARAEYAEIIPVAIELGDRRLESVARYNVARILFGEGQIEDARRMLEQALGVARQGGDRAHEALTLLELARVAQVQARLADAEALLADVDRTSAPSRQPLVLRAAALSRFDLLLARGDLAGARRVAESLRSEQEVAGNANGVREAEAALAMLAMDEERPGEAEPLARRAYDYWQREGNEIKAGMAAHHLARALWAQGRSAEARRLFVQAAAAAWRAGQRRHYAELRAERARFEGLDGSKTAIATLRELLEEAQRRGWEKAGLEIRLALGELEVRRQPAAGRARLASLVEDARQKGLDGVAARGQALLEPARVAHDAR